MFIGEFFIIFGWVHQKVNKKANIAYEKERAESVLQGRKGKSWQKYFWIFFPTLCDFVASSLSFIALTMIPGSIYSMLNGLIPIITGLFSLCILKSKFYMHNYIAMAIVIVGFALIGGAGFVGGGVGSIGISATELLVGILLQVLSVCFTSL